MKYRIFRTVRGHWDREYLQLKDLGFHWLDVHDFETWTACEAVATTFPEFETAMLLMAFTAQDPQRQYDFDTQTVKT